MKITNINKTMRTIVLRCGFFFFCIVNSFAATEETVIAVSANDFLNSIGANSAIYRRGENMDKTIECCQYAGIRWIRMDNVSEPERIRELYEKSGIKVSCSLGSANAEVDFDLPAFIANLREAALSGALIAVEGLNEPNNWKVKYQGEVGGGSNSWMPVARLHRDLYEAIKSDSVLKNYPVWATTETGAQTDNCGLQFLAIPEGANTLMPVGTKYADYATCHNYFTHPSWPGLHDNQTWHSSDPSKNCPVDGLYGNYGLTWSKKFPGYSDAELETLPRVTTETGVTIGGDITEEDQALLYMSNYLAQYKRNWSYTAMYILRDRTDESGNQTFGFFSGDYVPRKAAHYLHNLTTILADQVSVDALDSLSYSLIPERPATVHELLLQKADRTLMLVVWGEKFVHGSSVDNIEVHLSDIYREIKVYDPTQGVMPIQTCMNTNVVALSMLNHPYVIELKPSDVVSTNIGPIVAVAQRIRSVVNETLHIPACEPLERISLMDLSGKIVWQQDVQNSSGTFVDMSNFDAGYYLLRLIAADKTSECVKILKQ